jgi:hypothetical protein
VWEFGKLPEIVIEVVSNREGGELNEKKSKYRKMRVLHYVVWDPERMLSDTPLQAFELAGSIYRVVRPAQFDVLGLGLVVWHGEFEGCEADWLRWCKPDGTLLPTPDEHIAQEADRASREAERADREQSRREAAESELIALRAELARLRGA